MRDFSAAVGNYLNGVAALDAVRSVFFVSATALIWISDHPFYSLQGLTFGETERSAASTYVVFGAMAFLGLSLGWRNGSALRTLLIPSSILFGAWMVFNIVSSHNSGVSLIRFLLTASGMLLASSLLLVPKSRAELNQGLIIAALALLFLCYVGVALVPDLSTHTAKDIQEPHLAGDWRGTFGHKNAAGPMMAMLVFIGIYLTRCGAITTGPVITVLAALFLIFSGSKSSIALCIGVLLLAGIVKLFRSFAWRAMTCFVPLIIMNLLGVGTAVSPGLAEVAKHLPFDATYSGRDEVWKFSFDSLRGHVLTGYGYAAFWGSDPSTTKMTDEGSEWTVEAASSHNGYLDVTLTLGLPGLLLVLLICVVSPLKNFQIANLHGDDSFLADLFLQIWLLGIYLASTESFFLNRVDPSWLTFLIAVFGLHYLARFPFRA